jgi:ribonuclease HII
MQRLTIGIDEVGRGPLAGPVTVAAVATAVNSKFKIQNTKLLMLLHDIKDSKKLSSKQREEWYKKLNTECLTFSVASVGPKMIDRIGIVKATNLAVARCVEKVCLEIRPSNSMIHDSCFKIQLDGGLKAPARFINQQTIIKGDEKEPLISAASIIAKVTRDRYMVRMHKKFPEYSFYKHKGYGTHMHYEAIHKHGLCVLHRKSFCSII